MMWYIFLERPKYSKIMSCLQETLALILCKAWRPSIRVGNKKVIKLHFGCSKHVKLTCFDFSWNLYLKILKIICAHENNHFLEPNWSFMHQINLNQNENGTKRIYFTSIEISTYPKWIQEYNELGPRIKTGVNSYKQGYRK